MTIGQLVSGGGGFTAPLFLAGRLIGADMNSVAEQAIPVVGTAKWRIERIICTNASISLTTAKGAIYAAAGKTTPLAGMTTTSAFTGLTASGLASLLAQTASQTALSVSLANMGPYDKTLLNLYLSLTTAQGAAATADFYIFGIDLSNLPNHP